MRKDILRTYDQNLAKEMDGRARDRKEVERASGQKEVAPREEAKVHGGPPKVRAKVSRRA